MTGAPPASPLRLEGAGFALVFVGLGLARFGYPPLIPVMVSHGAVTPAGAGYLAAANFAGYLAGAVVADPDRDLLALACVERHKSTGNVGLGLIKGFGLKSGALAVSVGHDSHNITVVGADAADMRLAVETIVGMDGGLAVCAGGAVLARMPLPVAGLMTTAPLAEVVADLDALHAAARALGCGLPAPFITLSFMPLTVIPKLKLSDQGLIDVERFEKTSLFVEVGDQVA